MKLKYMISYVLALATTVSCTHVGDSVPTRTEKIVLGAPNRVGPFSDGDEIGLYLTSSADAGTQLLSGERFHENVKFIRIGEQFISNPAVFFPEESAAFNDLYAYSPWRENFIPPGTSVTRIGITSDQTERSGANDFRYATQLDFKANADHPLLHFKHAFAKVNIRVAPGGYYANVDEIPYPRSVTVKGVKMSGDFDFETLAFMPSAEVGEIIPSGTLTTEGSYLAGRSFILPPQQIPAGEIFMELVMGDDLFYLKPEKAIEFKAGTENNLTVVLNADFAGVLVNVDMEIAAWEDDGDHNLNETEVLPPSGETVTDVDGNQYGIIRIGKQYWMESNLRVTRFNDGTPLVKITDIAAQWRPAQNKGAYTSYMYDESDIEKNGLLYNRHAVEIDRICPEGWHVPSTTDWDILAKALGGKMDDYHSWWHIAAVMKSTEGWDAGMNGTNTSRFNARPAGYLFSLVDDQGTVRTRFYDKGNSAKFWSYTAMSGATSFIRSLNANDPDDALLRFLAANENGYSIRCVHDF